MAADPAVLPELVRRLDVAGIVAAEMALRLPSLDEVFLTLTGHHAEDQGARGERRWGGGPREDGLTSSIAVNGEDSCELVTVPV